MKKEITKNKISTDCMLGAHLSISKGLNSALYEAHNLKCNVLQIFTKNANTWKEKSIPFNEIELFINAKAETGIETIVSHTSYLINLASNDIKKQNMSCSALKNEMIRSQALNLSFVVIHPGSHMGSGEENGIYQISKNINQIFNELYEKSDDLSPKLLLETTAGQGTNLGYKFDHLASIIEKIADKNRIGVCLDTCHIFAAGYDIRSKDTYEMTIKAFDDIIGLEHLRLIHVNDSKKEFGSRIDRHEHIGKGEIGLKAFSYLMNDERLINIPKIIETPKDDEISSDLKNLEQLKSLVYKDIN